MAKTIVPIIPSGAFFPKTADGLILNPCSTALIDDRYLPVIEEITAAYIREEGTNLHSIYLRGSVPRGMAVGNCDIDTFALVFSENDRWREPNWANDFQEKLIRQFPFLLMPEIYLSSYAPVLRSFPDAEIPVGAVTNPNLAMLIQTQSLCIHGSDISPLIPAYRPDESMMLNNQWLKADITAYAKNKNDLRVRKQVLKTLLRSGFEQVMPKIQQYTPDLYLCYSSFAFYYPEQGDVMKKALEAFLNPKAVTKVEIDWIVDSMGEWLVEAFLRRN